jgi:hypothetical protein
VHSQTRRQLHAALTQIETLGLGLFEVGRVSS